MHEKSYKQEMLAATHGVDFSSYAYQVEFDTSQGRILVDLFSELAPEHCKNFIGLVELGFYNELTFHRVIADFVIEAGCPVGTGTGGPGYHIEAEFNERAHQPGVLSMARAQHPDSAGSQFFFCLKEVPERDGYYTVFGATADQPSLEVVLAIGRLPTNSEHKPLDAVRIRTVRILTQAGARSAATQAC